MCNSKKGKLHLQLSFLLTIVISINASAQILNQSSPFPLQIGNEWVYSSQSDTLTESVVDTQSIGGNLYYSIDEFRNSSVYLFRMFENKVFIYNWFSKFISPGYKASPVTFASASTLIRFFPISIKPQFYRLYFFPR